MIFCFERQVCAGGCQRPGQGFGDGKSFAQLRHHGVTHLVDHAKGLFLQTGPSNGVHDDGQAEHQYRKEQKEQKGRSKQQTVIPTHGKGIPFVHA